MARRFRHVPAPCLFLPPQPCVKGLAHFLPRRFCRVYTPRSRSVGSACEFPSMVLSLHPFFLLPFEPPLCPVLPIRAGPPPTYPPWLIQPSIFIFSPRFRKLLFFFFPVAMSASCRGPNCTPPIQNGAFRSSFLFLKCRRHSAPFRDLSLENITLVLFHPLWIPPFDWYEASSSPGQSFFAPPVYFRFPLSSPLEHDPVS